MTSEVGGIDLLERSGLLVRGLALYNSQIKNYLRIVTPVSYIFKMGRPCLCDSPEMGFVDKPCLQWSKYD